MNRRKGKKLDSKALAQQKRSRRRFLTFVRMLRYGVNNFSRNAWLTIAATAVMTITLLIIFSTFAARHVLSNTVDVIRDRVDMSIYLRTDAEEAEVEEAVEEIRKLESVRSVSYESPDQGRERFIEENKSDPAALNSLNQSDPQFPWTVRVNISDINDTSELQDLVDNNEVIAEVIHPDREPSFAGSMRTAIESIGNWVNFADRAGMVASVIFVAISSLIVFNTIRMAIFNRREEIQMMKLIGAERSFIRGPFVVEAVVYGFIAALIATGLGLLILHTAKDGLLEAGVAIDSTVHLMTYYSPFVLLVMIALGALIGIISSLLATRRYLKI